MKKQGTAPLLKHTSLAGRTTRPMRLESRIGPKHDDQAKEARAPCSECGHPTVHTIVTSAEYVSEDGDHRFSVQWWDDYQVLECKGCQNLCFRHVHKNTENTDFNIETQEEWLVETVHLYPKPATGRDELDHVDLLPSLVQQIYQETLAALNAGLRVLAGIGLRALVETMCKERAAVGKNLEARVDAMVGQGLISSEGAEILHGLRIMGNQAAHEVKPHTIEDLNTATDVIEHALQGVYILPKQASKLPRRAQKGASSQPNESAS